MEQTFCLVGLAFFLNTLTKGIVKKSKQQLLLIIVSLTFTIIFYNALEHQTFYARSHLYPFGEAFPLWLALRLTNTTH
jgi:hypothetical protein